jgi:hypothetical protein
MPTVKKTRGSELLSKHLSERGAQAAFLVQFNDGTPEAERADAPMLSRWVNGHSMPSRKAMARIEDLAGISMRAWAEDAKGSAA